MKISESDLNIVIKRVINETKNDRIVYGDMMSNKSLINQHIIKGFRPYYLDLKTDGDYKIIEVKNLKDNLPKTTFYFLDDREYKLLQRLVENINDLISDYIKMITLYRKQLIGVLEQKIIK